MVSSPFIAFLQLFVWVDPSTQVTSIDYCKEHENWRHTCILGHANRRLSFMHNSSFSHALWNVEQKALRPKKLYLSIFSETLAVFFVETLSNYIFILPVHAWIFSDLIISCYSSQPKHLQKVVLMNLQTRKARRNNLLRLQRKRLSFSFQVDKWISVFYFILFLICNIVDLVLDGIKASMMKVIC